MSVPAGAFVTSGVAGVWRVTHHTIAGGSCAYDADIFVSPATAQPAICLWPGIELTVRPEEVRRLLVHLHDLAFLERHPFAHVRM